MYGVSRIIVKLSRGVTIKKPLQPMSLKHAYYYSSVVALAPVIITSMESVGALGVYEVGLVIFLVIIGCVYVAKRTA
jgi:NADH:ubiquinone oxidoreductase subunit 3 (subunit A)